MLEMYDPTTDAWEPKADMPTKRWSHSASAVNGKIYAIGGWNGRFLSTVEAYDAGVGMDGMTQASVWPAVYFYRLVAAGAVEAARPMVIQEVTNPWETWIPRKCRLDLGGDTMLWRFRCFLFVVFSAVFVSVAYAAQNHVLSLDGDGDYVEIINNAGLNAINTQVTMEAWIKVSRFANVFVPIIYKGDSTNQAPPGTQWGNRSYSLWLWDTGALHLNGAASGQSRTRIDSPNGFIHVMTWYHVAGVINTQEGVTRLFINGVEVARGPFPRKVIRSSQLPLRIGWTHEEKRPIFAPFPGHIDEVRIWSVARTAVEIHQMMFTPHYGDMEKLRKPFYPNAQIIGYYEGQLIYDSLDEFIEFIKGVPVPSETGEAYEKKIVSIDVTQTIAAVKVSELYLGMRFTDYFSLLKTDDDWVIVSKTFQIH
jgi:hypothetical protein